MDISIYNYSSPRHYLLDFYTQEKKSNKEFSLRKWAKTMGLKSHTLLTFFLAGKREINLKHVDIISKGLRLSSQEIHYLKSLIQYQKAKTIEEKELLETYLNEIRPAGNFNSKEIGNYRVISDWSYAAILSVTGLDNFDGSIEDIHRRLKTKLQLVDLRAKVERLLSLNLLHYVDNNLTPTHNKTYTKDDLHNDGVKEYHKQTSTLAINAVDELNLDKREFQSYAVALDSEKVKKLKKLIRNFINSVEVVSQEGASDHVYQLNVQFFQLTENPILISDS